jgi:hypothetical protein
MGGSPSERSQFERLGLPGWAAIGSVVALVAAVVLLAYSWSALRTPNARRSVERTGTYSYRINADYQAVAPPSAVYPTGTVGTTYDEHGKHVAAGPLYTRLIDTLHVDVIAAVDRNGSAHDAKATLGATVTVRTPEGWSSVVSVAPDQAVARKTVLPVDIALPALRSQIATIGAETGVGGSNFTIQVDSQLTIAPTDSATSQGNAGPAVGRLEQTFTVDADVVQAAPIEPVTGSGVFGNPITRATSLSVLGIPVTVDVARIVFPGLALVAIGALIALAFVVFGGVGLRESERIAARYRTRIVDVAMTAAPGPVVLVGSVGELARIARAEQTVILHEELFDGSHRYRVVLGSVTYEHQTAPEHAGRASDLLADSDGEP